MLLIATDEAGYGPKLGPLVIGATTWHLPTGCSTELDDLQRLFSPLAESHQVAGVKVVINDSKAVFKPKSLSSKSSSSKSGTDSLQSLHCTVSAANFWHCCQHRRFVDWIAAIAPHDRAAIDQTPWLSDLDQGEFDVGDELETVVAAWRREGIELSDARARILPAAKFNHACDGGLNKADLLSETTLGMVREILTAPSNDSDQSSASPRDAKRNAIVFCDRHGGRRYYAGVLQHVFDGASVQVVSESKHLSVYRVSSESIDATIHFTVKGDSFAPVALSSIYAKYIRERMMQSLNRYFAKFHSDPTALRPTAGYPTDADRFLNDIGSIIDQKQIDHRNLVRQR
ncbi:MAG: hypothetical protein HKN47_14800 [Pirellulaceae bacterium]|nr:hypothetical protein [Pirellulaceae bacterium]